MYVVDSVTFTVRGGGSSVTVLVMVDVQVLGYVCHPPWSTAEPSFVAGTATTKGAMRTRPRARTGTNLGGIPCSLWRQRDCYEVWVPKTAASAVETPENSPASSSQGSVGWGKPGSARVPTTHRSCLLQYMKRHIRIWVFGRARNRESNGWRTTGCAGGGGSRCG